MQLKASYFSAKSNWHEIPKGNEISFLFYCFPIKGEIQSFIERIALSLYSGFSAAIVDGLHILHFLVA